MTSSNSSSPSLSIGDLITLLNGRHATIRFLGPASFAPGPWVGIEFAEPIGKNNGSVQGVRYFECPPGCGMFIRAAGVASVLEEGTPRVKDWNGGSKEVFAEAKKTVVKRGGVGRESLTTVAAGKRGAAGSVPLDYAARKRETLNAASPTPAARQRANVASVVGSAAGSWAVSSAASSRQGSPSLSGSLSEDKSRSVSQASLTRGSVIGKSGTGSGSVSSRASRTSSSVASKVSIYSSDVGDETITQDMSGRGASNGDGMESTRDETASRSSSVAWSASQSSAFQHGEPSVRGPPEASIVTNKARIQPATSTRPSKSQVQDLESKIRALERKRLEDREKLKKLEQLKLEKERLEGIIQKLQAKFQPQQVEMVNLRRQLKDSGSKTIDVETLQAEHDAALEMATLDREIAEQSAEGFRTELEALKQRAEELELDIEILREENKELGREMNPEEKTSQGWLQMEKSNERLRDALSRLREITQSQETELKIQIASLERDVRQMGDIKGQYEIAQKKLRRSDDIIHDLRQQLEVAAGSEEMLERLTEENLVLSEQVGDLKVSLEDLEDLKELNDELEQNHVATEKQMQEELDFKDAVLGEQAQQVSRQESKLVDYEQTISKFRELVANLQNHLQDLKASKQITEAEAEELNTRSNAMADINLKLQNTAAKSQVDHFNQGLQKAEAEEAVEHLKIVQSFLVDATSTDRNSILAYFRIKQVAFRAKLLQTTLADQLSSPAGVPIAEPFPLCEAVEKLMWIAAMCERLIGHISSCSLEAFARYEGALHDLEPMRRNLDSYIDGIRSGNLRPAALVEELQRSKAVLSHMSEMHLTDDTPHDFMNGLVLYAKLNHGYLQNVTYSLFQTKTMVGSVSTASSNSPERLSELSDTLDQCLYQARGAPVAANKIVRAVEDLRSRSMSLRKSVEEDFQRCEEAAIECVAFTRALSQHVDDAIRRADVLDITAMEALLSSLSTFRHNDTDMKDPFTVLSTYLRTATTLLSSLAAQTTDLTQTTEFTQAPPPWSLRAAQLRITKSATDSTTADLSRLKQSLVDAVTQLHLRDATVEEQSIKIQHLESRMRDNAAKAAHIASLDAALDAAKARESDLNSALEASTRNFAAANAEREEYRRLADARAAKEGVDGGSVQDAERNIASAREVRALKLEIEGLQGAVRYLRSDGNRGGKAFAGDDLAWLEAPLGRCAKGNVGGKVGVREIDGVFDALLGIVAGAEVVNLSVLKDRDRRLKWRPVREKSAWLVARQVEEWEGWVAKRDRVLRDAC